MTPPSETTVAVWTGLMRAGTRLLGEIEAALKAEGLPPLAWYDVLLELERAGEAGLRPFELTERLLLPQYGTSRLLARLEAEGLVARAPCPGDGRGQVVAATPAGREMRARMWPVYARELDRLVGARLGAEEAAALAGLLARLVSR